MKRLGLTEEAVKQHIEQKAKEILAEATTLGAQQNAPFAELANSHSSGTTAGAPTPSDLFPLALPTDLQRERLTQLRADVASKKEVRGCVFFGKIDQNPNIHQSAHVCPAFL